MSAATVRAAAWDDALLTLLYEHGGELTTQQLMAAVLEESANAIARLQERGLIGPAEEEQA